MGTSFRSPEHLVRFMPIDASFTTTSLHYLTLPRAKFISNSFVPCCSVKLT